MRATHPSLFFLSYLRLHVHIPRAPPNNPFTFSRQALLASITKERKESHASLHTGLLRYIPLLVQLRRDLLNLLRPHRGTHRMPEMRGRLLDRFRSTTKKAPYAVRLLRIAPGSPVMQGRTGKPLGTDVWKLYVHNWDRPLSWDSFKAFQGSGDGHEKRRF